MSLHKYHHRSLLHSSSSSSSSSSSLLLMNKTRCEIALDLSLRAVQHDLDGDSAFARKLYEDAARALEDAIAHAKKEKSMETNDIKQMESKVKEYRERAKILNATKGGDTCNEKESKSNVAAGAAAAGAMIGFAAMGPLGACLLYTSPSPRDLSTSRMPSSA